MFYSVGGRTIGTVIRCRIYVVYPCFIAVKKATVSRMELTKGYSGGSGEVLFRVVDGWRLCVQHFVISH